jgi:hypothetical protein
MVLTATKGSETKTFSMYIPHFRTSWVHEWCNVTNVLQIQRLLKTSVQQQLKSSTVVRPVLTWNKEGRPQRLIIQFSKWDRQYRGSIIYDIQTQKLTLQCSSKKKTVCSLNHLHKGETASTLSACWAAVNRARQHTFHTYWHLGSCRKMTAFIHIQHQQRQVSLVQLYTLTYFSEFFHESSLTNNLRMALICDFWLVTLRCHFSYYVISTCTTIDKTKQRYTCASLYIKKGGEFQ